MGRYALILVFAGTFALLVYSQGLKNAYLTSQHRVVNKINTIQAHNIAQSAAIIKVKQIIEGSDYTSIEGEWSEEIFGQYPGEYEVQITQAGDILTVLSSGKYGNVPSTVEVKMQINATEQVWQPNLSHAVFAGSSIKMSGSSRIEGDVGTNSTNAGAVEMAWSTVITGSLSVGPGGNPDEVLKAANHNVNASVHGGVTAASQEQVFELPPFYEYPSQANPLEPISVNWEGPFKLKASELNSYIPSISISGSYTLEIDTEGEDIVLHVGDFNISQGHLKFKGGGKVTLLVEDKFTFGGSSTLNNDGDISDFMTYYKGNDDINIAGATNFNSHFYAETADVTLSGSGGLQGSIITGGDKVTISGAADAISRVVYAPNADIKITGSGSVKGSVVAKTFDASGAAEVIFESDSEYEIPDISLQDQITKPVIVYWK